MEMMRDIPGYKTALKVVLRSQIQFLAEQLSSETDEETVILSASTVDGALYQLGSQYGRYFLQDKGDIQSKFSQHCLNKTLESPTVKDATHMTAVAAERALSDPDHSVAQSSSRGEVRAKPGLIYQPETVSNTDYAKQDQSQDCEQIFTDAKPSKTEPDPDKGQRRKKRKRKSNDSSTKNTKLSLDMNDSLESVQNDQADTVAHEVKTNKDSAMDDINLEPLHFEHGGMFFTPSSVKTTDGTGDKSKVKVEPESDNDDYIDNTGEVSDGENMESIEDMESHVETSAASTSIGDRTPKLEVAEPEMGKKAKHDVSFEESSSDDINDQALCWSALNVSTSKKPRSSQKMSAEKPICQDCGKRFSSLPALKRHCKTHIPGLVRCSICHLFFRSKEERLVHIDIKHNNVCHICGKIVYRNMKAHMKWHEGTLTPKYTCPIEGCNKAFDKIARVEDHMNTHTEFDESSSVDGNNQALSWTALDLSMSKKPEPSQKSTERPMCQECGKTFSSIHALKRHAKSHIPNLIKCSPCQQYFYTLRDREEHMIAKHNKVCEVCGKTVFRSMKDHMKKHEGTLIPKYTCPMDGCNKTFDKKTFFEDHMNMHLGNKPYECQICSSKFTSKYKRNNHFKLCSGLMTIECNICGQLFRHRGSLLNHKAKHSGQRFKCECGAIFKYKSGFNRHKKITNHTGGSRYFDNS